MRSQPLKFLNQLKMIACFLSIVFLDVHLFWKKKVVIVQRKIFFSFWSQIPFLQKKTSFSLSSNRRSSYKNWNFQIPSPSKLSNNRIQWSEITSSGTFLDSTDDGFEEIQVLKFQQFARVSWRKPYQEDVHQSDRCRLRWSVVLELHLSKQWHYNHSRVQTTQKRPGHVPFPMRALQQGLQDQARLLWTLHFPEAQHHMLPGHFL